jgi:biotin synthase
MNVSEIVGFLQEQDSERINALFDEARRLKREMIGPNVYLRGIVEFSNYCVKDCYYCGIRRGNSASQRFQMTKEEILECARFCERAGYGSLVLQSGERQDSAFVDFVEESVRSIKTLGGESTLGITLSCGEQPRETYQRWFDAGAHRYLLRIEASNPVLYRQIHPLDHDYAIRLRCLADLKEIGYQVGTGVMIGLPGQTLEDLAADLLFFRDQEIDMIGMGPYIPHQQAPLNGSSLEIDPAGRLTLGLKMIALARLLMPDVNIAAATALQALDDAGRERGILAGANIIMPNVTTGRYRKLYQLYEGKPCLDENAKLCRSCLATRIHALGETIGYGEWGDSLRFARRQKSIDTGNMINTVAND